MCLNPKYWYERSVLHLVAVRWLTGSSLVVTNFIIYSLEFGGSYLFMFLIQTLFLNLISISNRLMCSDCLLVPLGLVSYLGCNRLSCFDTLFTVPMILNRGGVERWGGGTLCQQLFGYLYNCWLCNIDCFSEAFASVGLVRY